MATFARVEREFVVDIVKVDDSCAPDEQAGAEFLSALIPGEWVQTFYPVNQPDPYPRGKYAAIGDAWDGERFYTVEPSAPTQNDL